MRWHSSSWYHGGSLVLVGLVLGVIPFAGTTYVTVVVLQMLMFMALASSFNLITGFTGYMSFGHVVYFGAGAYMAGVLVMHAGAGWIVASVAGGLTAAALASIAGAICLRLRSYYFSMATFGLNEIVRVGVLLAEPWTRGGMGISIPPVVSVTVAYYVMAGLALAVVMVTYFVLNSRFGLALMTIREDEDAARVCGIPTVLYKIIAFLLSAFFPGVVGGVYAHYIGFIEPNTVFFPFISFQLIIFALFGGLGTVLGPVVGTVTLFLLWEVLWVRFPFLHLAIFGFLLVLVVRFMPRGVIGVASRKGLGALELKIPLRARLLAVTR